MKKVAFEKLSKPQQRVAIAKDVLSALKKKKINPKHMSWVLITKAIEQEFRNASDTTEVKDIINAQEHCECCALGACFIATLNRNGSLPVAALSHIDIGNGFAHRDVLNYLQRYFDEPQLEAIESAFEQGVGYYYNGKAAKWRPELTCPTKRLRAIMTNIVNNNGRFCWTKP